jgi:hypothetical protein
MYYIKDMSTKYKNIHIKIGDKWEINEYEAFKTNNTGNNVIKHIWGYLSYEVKDIIDLESINYYAVSLKIVYDDSDSVTETPDIKTEIITAIYNKKMKTMKTIEKPTKNNPIGLVSLKVISKSILQVNYIDSDSTAGPGYVYVVNLNKANAASSSSSSASSSSSILKTDEVKTIKIKRGMKWEVMSHNAYEAELSKENKLLLKNWGYLSYEIKDIRKTNVRSMYAASVKILYDDADDVKISKPNYKIEIVTAIYNEKTGVFKTIEKPTAIDPLGISTLTLISKNKMRIEYIDTDKDVGSGHVYISYLKRVEKLSVDANSITNKGVDNVSDDTPKKFGRILNWF